MPYKYPPDVLEILNNRAKAIQELSEETPIVVIAEQFGLSKQRIYQILHKAGVRVSGKNRRRTTNKIRSVQPTN